MNNQYQNTGWCAGCNQDNCVGCVTPCVEPNYDDSEENIPFWLEPKITDAPSVISLVYGEIEQDARHSDCNEVTWSQIPMYSSDVKYIRADIAESLHKALSEFYLYFSYEDRPSYFDKVVLNALNLYKEATK